MPKSVARNEIYVLHCVRSVVNEEVDKVRQVLHAK